MTIKLSDKGVVTLSAKIGTIELDNEQIVLLPTTAKQDKFMVTSPGEYEIGGIGIFSFAPYPTIITELDHIVIAYIPNPPETYPADVMSELERADVLLVAGKHHELVSKIAPLYVIPLNDHSIMAEKIGAEPPEIVNTLTIKTRAELPEETELVYLG